MLPVISLIGKKNVGKSTLFNRLTNTQNALTADYSGLTRDRQYGVLRYKLFDAVLIDTGGIDDVDYNSIEVEIKKKSIFYQIIEAIKESDIILLVIDGQSRETFVNHNIINFLRKLEKKIFIIINKIDNRSYYAHDILWDFYVFGVENIFPISAIHGFGVNTLLKKLSHYITNNTIDKSNNIFINNKNIPFLYAVENQICRNLSLTSGNQDNVIILAIIGRPNAGKSTFVNYVAGSDRMIISDKSGTTRDSIYISVVYQSQKYVLIDTAGIKKKKKINDIAEKVSILRTLQVIKDAHVILFMFDAYVGISDDDLSLLNIILNQSNRALIVAVNKWDSISSVLRSKIKDIFYRKIDFINFIKVHFISALYGRDVDNLLQSVQKIYCLLSSIRTVISTNKLTRLMYQATGKNPPPTISCRKKIKLKYAHIGGYSPVILVIHGNYVSRLPMSYKRYLKNFLYQRLGIAGIIVRIYFKDNMKNPFS